MTPQTNYTPEVLKALADITIRDHFDVAARVNAAAIVIEAERVARMEAISTITRADIIGEAQPEPAEQPARTRRSRSKPTDMPTDKPAEDKPMLTAAEAEQVRAPGAIPDTEPAPVVVNANGDDVKAEDVEPAADTKLADAPAVQADVPTREELIALLNRYSGKHPGKQKAAKEAMAKYGSERVSEISPGDWPALASDLKAYLGE